MAKEKGFALIFIILVAAIVAILGFYFVYSRNINKFVSNSPSPTPLLKTEYENPFSEKSQSKDNQYQNPFSDYTNPFDTLAE